MTAIAESTHQLTAQESGIITALNSNPNVRILQKLLEAQAEPQDEKIEAKPATRQLPLGLGLLPCGIGNKLESIFAVVATLRIFTGDTPEVSKKPCFVLARTNSSLAENHSVQKSLVLFADGFKVLTRSSALGKETEGPVTQAELKSFELEKACGINIKEPQKMLEARLASFVLEQIGWEAVDKNKPVANRDRLSTSELARIHQNHCPNGLDTVKVVVNEDHPTGEAKFRLAKGDTITITPIDCGLQVTVTSQRGEILTEYARMYDGQVMTRSHHPNSYDQAMFLDGDLAKAFESNESVTTESNSQEPRTYDSVLAERINRVNHLLQSPILVEFAKTVLRNQPIIITESPGISLVLAGDKILIQNAQSPQELKQLDAESIAKFRAEDLSRLAYSVVRGILSRTRFSPEHIFIKPSQLRELEIAYNHLGDTGKSLVIRDPILNLSWINVHVGFSEESIDMYNLRPWMVAQLVIDSENRIHLCERWTLSQNTNDTPPYNTATVRRGLEENVIAKYRAAAALV